jgi:2-keto-4-pentenoate hydratase
MSFSPVNYSQQDQAWKSVKIGSSSETIGHVGCALTSLAMQTMLGVKEPDYGHILNTMVVMEGEKVPTADLIKPRIEGELAFVLREDLQGPGVTLTEVIRCSEGVIPAWRLLIAGFRLENQACRYRSRQCFQRPDWIDFGDDYVGA